MCNSKERLSGSVGRAITTIFQAGKSGRGLCAGPVDTTSDKEYKSQCAAAFKVQAAEHEQDETIESRQT